MIVDEKLGEVPLRILYYHKGGPTTAFSIALTVQNTGTRPVQINVLKSMAGPSPDELFVGHRASKEFLLSFLGQDPEKIILAPGATQVVLLQPLRQAQVSSGLVLLNPVKPGEVTVKLRVVDPELMSLALNHMPVGRAKFTYGLFPQALQRVTVQYNGTPAVYDISIGDEPFLKDSRNGMKLAGNYGVVYLMDIQLTNPTTAYRTVEFYFSPTAGIARGAFLIDSQLYEVHVVDFSTQLRPEKFYQVALAPRQSRSVSLLTIPAGGSFYPVRLMLRNSDIRFQ